MTILSVSFCLGRGRGHSEGREGLEGRHHNGHLEARRMHEDPVCPGEKGVGKTTRGWEPKPTLPFRPFCHDPRSGTTPSPRVFANHFYCWPGKAAIGWKTARAMVGHMGTKHWARWIELEAVTRKLAKSLEVKALC